MVAVDISGGEDDRGEAHSTRSFPRLMVLCPGLCIVCPNGALEEREAPVDAGVLVGCELLGRSATTRYVDLGQIVSVSLTVSPRPALNPSERTLEVSSRLDED
jgi:hypothetical protein